MTRIVVEEPMDGVRQPREADEREVCVDTERDDDLVTAAEVLRAVYGQLFSMERRVPVGYTFRARTKCAVQGTGWAVFRCSDGFRWRVFARGSVDHDAFARDRFLAMLEHWIPGLEPMPRMY